LDSFHRALPGKQESEVITKEPWLRVWQTIHRHKRTTLLWLLQSRAIVYSHGFG
jgi:hypothetical protein